MKIPKMRREVFEKNYFFKHCATLRKNPSILNLSFQLDPSKMDRVELAFRKFDLNHDGFLSREEFDMVSNRVTKQVLSKSKQNLSNINNKKSKQSSLRSL